MAKFGIEQLLRKAEDARLLTGQRRSAAELGLARRGRGLVGRLPHTHADVVPITPRMVWRAIRNAS